MREMLDLPKKLYELMVQKRDLLSEISDLCKREVKLAQEDNWAEFDTIAEEFKSLTNRIDELDILVNEIVSKEEIKDQKLEKLETEIEVLVRECLVWQKQTADVIASKKVEALGQLNVLEKKNDAFRAYGRTATYYQSVPKFIDDKK
jgi:septal ring factor EnvC (AmiA/AmiB activator)